MKKISKVRALVGPEVDFFHGGVEICYILSVDLKERSKLLHYITYLLVFLPKISDKDVVYERKRQGFNT